MSEQPPELAGHQCNDWPGAETSHLCCLDDPRLLFIVQRSCLRRFHSRHPRVRMYVTMRPKPCSVQLHTARAYKEPQLKKKGIPLSFPSCDRFPPIFLIHHSKKCRLDKSCFVLRLGIRGGLSPQNGAFFSCRSWSSQSGCLTYISSMLQRTLNHDRPAPRLCATPCHKRREPPHRRRVREG